MNIRQYEDTIILTNVTDDESTKIYRLVQGKSEDILPRPVIRDGNGKPFKKHTSKYFFLRLQEEIFEVMESEMKFTYAEFLAEEIADVITVCISQLEALGYDEEKRSEIFRKVNEKNEKRGYFKGSD